MTYIPPNSTVQLFKNIHIDPGYNDTLYFASPTEQNAYFETTENIVQTLDSMSYIRKGKLKLRYTPNNWAEAYEINYMRFRNTSYENKWFYCYVSSVDYINNSTAEISFVVDAIQTWYIGTGAQNHMLESYIIREHAITDEIGENIQPEPVTMGEFVEDRTTREQIGFTDIAYIVMVVNTSNWTSGKLLGQVYSGATAYYYTHDDVDGIDTLLDSYIQAPDSVLAIYTIPAIDDVTSGSEIRNIRGYWHTVSANALSKGDELNGYVPRNNKCYTYPYTYLRVFAYDGNYADFRYEFFTDAPSFMIASTIVQPVKAVCMPRNYKGADGSEVPTEGVSISGFPACSWNNDTYAAWLAQNSVPMNNLTKAQQTKIALRTEQTNTAANYRTNMALANAVMSIATMAIDAMTGNFGGIGTGLSAISSLVNSQVTNSLDIYNTSVGNAISNIDFNTAQENAHYAASIEADTIHGTIGSGNMSIMLDRPGFYATRITQPSSYMSRIDNYFDLYGYAYNGIGVPNISSRPCWNYARVSDIQLDVSIPADALAVVKQIFENGIRFWKRNEEVGNYSLDNSPLTA